MGDPSSNGVRGVVAVGASAGGVEALIRFAGSLPADLPLPVLVAIHMPVSGPSVLAQILDRHSSMKAVTATHGQAVEPGRIYVAVPNRHLLVSASRIALSLGPTENGHRPAINALFRSAAVEYGRRSICILLSGVLDDGVLGLSAIRSRGGVAVVQKPSDALFPGMPLNAINARVVDHQAAAGDMGALLATILEHQSAEIDMNEDPKLELENRIALGNAFTPAAETESLGPPSGYACPDCNGALLEVGEHNYRCRVGHAWTAESLLRARDSEVEGAMWVALRGLQEKVKLSRKLADAAGPGVIKNRYSALADESDHALTVLARRMSEAFSPGAGRNDE